MIRLGKEISHTPEGHLWIKLFQQFRNQTEEGIGGVGVPYILTKLWVPRWDQIWNQMYNEM